MIRTFTWWEVGVATAIILLAAQQFLGLLIARRKGLTGNVSRLVTYGVLAGLGLLYAVLSVRFASTLEAADAMAGFRSLPTANWTYLVAAVMIGLVAAYEASSHVGAMRAGLTRNVSRLVSLAGIIVLLLVLIGISAAKWDLYLERLESTYREAVGGPTASGPGAR